MVSLQFLLFFRGIICCYSQRNYVIHSKIYVDAQGCYGLVSNENVTFEAILISEYINRSLLLDGYEKPKIERYYKHDSRNYYLVFWSCWKDSYQCKYWCLIDRASRGISGILDEERDSCATPMSPIPTSNEGTTIIDIGPVIGREIIRNKDADFQKQGELEESKIIMHEQKEMIQNLSKQIDEHKRLQVSKETLEHDAGMDALHIVLILIIAAVFIVAIIFIIYYCISKKSEKNRMQKTQQLMYGNNEIKIEPKIKRRDKFRNRAQPKTQVKEEGNQTKLGRFEPESFSDAINNLPAVQDVVLDGIMDEMKTEEGKKQ